MIGIGHIGAGRMARGRAADLLTHQGVRMVVGWSRGQANRDAYEDLTGAPAVGDWRSVVENAEVDAVCIGTPTATHVEFAMAALAAGKHVLLECPACAGPAEFDRMMQAARGSGVALYVGSNYRFSDAAQAFRWGAERVGRPLLARADSTWTPAEGSDWYFDRGLSGGLFPCVHLYQFTLFAPLGPGVRVEAELGDAGRHGVAMVRYAGEAIAVATGGFERYGANDFLLVGTEGMMSRQEDGAPALVRGGHTESVPVESVDTTHEDNAAFVRCVRGEQHWQPHADSERAIHSVAFAAQRSAEGGEPVAL